MKTLTQQAQEWIAPHLKPGDVTVDATAGNGYDTCFLAEQVGVLGKVFAFDVQQLALEKTSQRLSQLFRPVVETRLACHSELLEQIPREFHGRVACVMFNLGYLPGADKQLVTRQETTSAALEQSLQLLKPGGVLSVLAYVGHPGGLQEAAVVEQFFRDSEQKLILS